MRRSVIVLVLSALLGISPGAYSAQAPRPDPDSLYRTFLDPPRDFSPMPFWFWNGKMEGSTVQREIRDMVDQHVYGAFLHGRDGLQTPYLSDEWFKAIEAGLQQSRKSEFEFNFLDEYDWPSGEGRNVWMSGNHQSEVLSRRPDLRMKTLSYESKIIDGPAVVDLPVDPDSQAIVAARWLGKNRIDSTTLTQLNSGAKEAHIHWSAPEGQWVVVQFSLRPAMGFDGGFVDLMNPDATNLFFDLVYGEYHRRFASYFGTTIRYAFSDHEGDYGYRIAWTPRLFDTFQARAGYDLHKMLPLLIYDGGVQTAKLRMDYLSTVTGLYADSFWRGITDRAEKIGVHRTGHVWEESLQWAAALEGSLFDVERGLNPVGVDSLFDWGRQPLNFKVAQSVADFEGRRFACENQGVQGTDSYLDLEGIRKGTNGIAASGVNLFIPHAFDYDSTRANYPPDWLHQPYWSYFHTYADYTRRISYMNADSRHVTNALIYYPIKTIWAGTRPLFSGEADYQRIGEPGAWKNETVLINDYYSRIISELSSQNWDYNIADDQYIADAHVEGNELVIGPQRFRAIILPPISAISRATLEKLIQFHQAGGVIIGIRLLPTASPEAGANDSMIKDGIASIFDGGTQAASREPTQPERGNSLYVNDSVETLVSALGSYISKDVQVTFGPAQHLLSEHRRKNNVDYYWVVNDTDRKRINHVHFSVKGIPEKWDALTGEREPLFYVNDASGTDVRLNLDPWDAFYVVFRPLSSTPQDAVLQTTNAEHLDSVSNSGPELKVHISSPVAASGVSVELRRDSQVYRGVAIGNGAQPISLGDEWQFQPKPARISVPYAKVSDTIGAAGIASGWVASDFDDADWPELWLSPQQDTVRQWQVIGPFPNTDNDSFAKVYPPEEEFEPQKQYDGFDSAVRWQDYDANEPYLSSDGGWGAFNKTTGGGPFSDASYIVNFGPELLTDDKRWIVSYAHTYLYSPRDMHAKFLVAADNWVSIWLDHKRVFSQLRTPFWYELNDSWADHVPVDLHKGWNEVLVKVGKGRDTPSGFYGFSFRVTDDEGKTLSQVTVSTFPKADGGSTANESDELRFYRVDVPPGCVAVVPPALQASYRMILNGHDLRGSGDAPIDIRPSLRSQSNRLVIIAKKNDPLLSPVQFVTGETPFSLRPLVGTGLANFSGTVSYKRVFSLPPDYDGMRVMLDLGRVSSVADVFVNGHHAGTLVWRPYRLDISKLVKPGENEIQILVTNSEANERAVGTRHHILPAIDVDGLEGPVELIPYIDQIVTLKQTGETSKEHARGDQ